MARRALAVSCLIGLITASPEGFRLRAQSAAESQSFAASAGDTIVIQNDYGRVRVRGTDGSQLQARLQKTAADKNTIETVAQRGGDKIFFYSFFSGAPGESVDLEIDAPRFVNLVIWGANPEVEISGVNGYVRVQNFTGRITAENLTSSVTIVSEKGDIRYRATVQPLGDVRLETVAGRVDCELARSLNLRGWLRAGGRLSWDRDAEMQAASAEKQLGTFGPLLCAGSLRSDVKVVLVEGSRSLAPPPPPPAPKPVPPPAEETRREPAPIPAATPETQPSTRPAEGTQPSGQYSLKVDVDSVFMNVSVRDQRTSRSIAGLGRRDFAVYEDNRPQEITQFVSAEAPFNLLLLLDVSGSTRSFIDLMKDASIDFTREIKENDRIAVATFNSDVRLVHDFTEDRVSVARAIQGIRSGGGTAFYDALMTSVDDYMRGMEGRKAIVVFSDGVDNALEGNMSEGSRTPFDQLYRRIQEIDTIIYTIFLDTEGYMTVKRGGGSSGVVIDILGGVLGRRTPRRTTPYPTGRRGSPAVYDEARDQMLAIADQTGGRMYAPSRIEDLASTYSEIADDLRIQYQLGYNSTNPVRDGRWRAIRVDTPTHPEAAVRTRKGYYASATAARPRRLRP